MNTMLATLERIVSGQSASCSQTWRYSFMQRRMCHIRYGNPSCPRQVDCQRPLAVTAAAKPSRPSTKASLSQKGDKGKIALPGKTSKGNEQNPKRTASQPARSVSSPVSRDNRSQLNTKPQAASSRLPRPDIPHSSRATAVSTPDKPPRNPTTPEYERLQQSSSANTVPPTGASLRRIASAADPSPEDNLAVSASNVTSTLSVAAGLHAPPAAAAAAEEAESKGGKGTEDDGFLAHTDAAGPDDGAAAGGGGDGDGDDDGDMFPEIRLALPPPTNVKVKIAQYLQSCVSVSECPPPRFPEFAVIGRSNVGKSSLINMLTGRKDLAMVSKEPGKTRCINHFLINDCWYLVDLPGYGFAKVGMQMRQQFEEFTRTYFRTRPNLAMVLLLVDASVPPQAIDLSYANWLIANEVPFALVFTKADKRRKGLTSSSCDSHVTAFKRALLRDLAFLPPSIMTSANKGLGRGELLNFIASLRVAYVRSGRLQAIRQGML